KPRTSRTTRTGRNVMSSVKCRGVVGQRGRAVSPPRERDEDEANRYDTAGNPLAAVAKVPKKSIAFELQASPPPRRRPEPPAGQAGEAEDQDNNADKTGDDTPRARPRGECDQRETDHDHDDGSPHATRTVHERRVDMRRRRE